MEEAAFQEFMRTEKKKASNARKKAIGCANSAMNVVHNSPKYNKHRKEEKEWKKKENDINEAISRVAYYHYNVLDKNSHEVELHGQRKEECLQIVRTFLLYCSRVFFITNLVLITGYGKPKPGQPEKSEEEKGILREAVRELLEQENMLVDNIDNQGRYNQGRFNITFRPEDRNKHFIFLSKPEDYCLPWNAK